MSSAAFTASGFETRWAHRQDAYVPNHELMRIGISTYRNGV
jgi:hypothetical protein